MNRKKKKEKEKLMRQLTLTFPLPAFGFFWEPICPNIIIIFSIRKKMHNVSKIVSN